jgi:hypothetical protein
MAYGTAYERAIESGTGTPTDFTRLRSQAAYCSSWSVTAGCPEGPRAQILGPRWVHDLAPAASQAERRTP